MNTIDSLYIHFPLCRHLCNYCDFYKTAPSANDRSAKITDFHEYLSTSLVKLNELLESKSLSWRPLETLYIGGGTPSLWGESGANFLKDFLKEKIKGMSENCEATIEVNPGAWTDESVKAFLDVGFNRFSIGVQSTEDYFLEKLDRVHRKEETLRTLSYFQSIKANYSVDFMLGLPFSKEGSRDILKELEEILSYDPSHLSLYILTVKNNYKHYKNLPDDEWVEKEFLEVSEFLRSRGFSHYEVSNFAVKGKESKHNLRYWAGQSVAALGPSATGYLSGNSIRFKWKSQVNEMEIERLAEAEVRMEKFYLGLRTLKGIDLKLFFEGEEYETACILARSWAEKGLGVLDGSCVALTPRGYLLMDSLMDEVFNKIKSV